MSDMGTVLAVCVSREKGTQKENIGTAVFLEDWGIQGDAHAGKWHRQVSLLSHEKIEAFRARGAEVADGAFGENLVVAGIDFRSLPLGTRFQCNDVVLKLTQIGKECHNGCAIYQAMGECIMPVRFPWATRCAYCRMRRRHKFPRRVAGNTDRNNLEVRA